MFHTNACRLQIVYNLQAEPKGHINYQSALIKKRLGILVIQIE